MKPLTPAQWALVVDNRRLLGWVIARMAHPTRQAAADAADAALDALIAAARNWVPGRAAFGYYAMRLICRRVRSERARAAARDDRLRESLRVRASLAKRQRRNDADALVAAVLSPLPPHERDAVRARYGLDGGPERTGAALAAALGVPRGTAAHRLGAAHRRGRLAVLHGGNA